MNSKYFIAFSIGDAGSWEFSGLNAYLERGDESRAYDSHEEAAARAIGFQDSAVKIIKVEVISSSDHP